jgi:hypothetical protein
MIICNICLAIITLLIIGLALTRQLTVTKANATITSAVDSLPLINDRIVSVCVEWEEESILILFVITSSRVPGDTSEAPTASPCLCNLHQGHCRSAVVNSAMDTLVGPFIAICSSIQQFERYHIFFCAFEPFKQSCIQTAFNNVKDKFLILRWSHFWAPCSFFRLAFLSLCQGIQNRRRFAGYHLDWISFWRDFLWFF